MSKLSSKLSLVLTVAACATLLPSLAEAVPALSVRAYDITDGTERAVDLATLSTAGGGGFLAYGSNTNFSTISVSGSGAAGANGGLATVTLDTAGKANTTLRLQITQTGLTATTAAQPFMITFTLNALTSGSDRGSADFSTFVDRGNVAYGKAQLLASQDLTGSAATNTYAAQEVGTGLTPGGLYSESQQIDISFGTTGTITASSQIIPVPEPASLALLGAGLAALGVARRRASLA